MDQVPLKNDEDRHKIYVALTRAKENLYIHCNTDMFDPYQISNVKKESDSTAYSPPEELTLQLTHKDVVLDFFKGEKAQILSLAAEARWRSARTIFHMAFAFRRLPLGLFASCCIRPARPPRF